MSKTVRVSRKIYAPAAKIFDILADPTRHLEIDGSGQVREYKKVPERLSLGAKFSMGISQGAKYTTVNKVIAYEENKVIAWTHIGKHIWRYELNDNGDNTTDVTEIWDWSPCPLWERIGLEIARYPQRNKNNMAKTLENIARIVESN